MKNHKFNKHVILDIASDVAFVLIGTALVIILVYLNAGGAT